MRCARVCVYVCVFLLLIFFLRNCDPFSALITASHWVWLSQDRSRIVCHPCHVMSLRGVSSVHLRVQPPTHGLPSPPQTKGRRSDCPASRAPEEKRGLQCLMRWLTWYDRWRSWSIHEERYKQTRPQAQCNQYRQAVHSEFSKHTGRTTNKTNNVWNK